MAELSPPCIALVPSPGMGHLIPFVELGKLLVEGFGLRVSLLIPSVGRGGPSPAQSRLLGSLPDSISCTFLEPVDPACLHGEGANVIVAISAVMAHSAPSVQAALARMPGKPAALITDLFGSCLFGLARELGVPPYLYFTGSGMFLVFCMYLPKLDEMVSCEYRDLPDPVVLPGCGPVHGRDLQDAVQDRKGEAYRVWLDMVKRYVLAEGIFVNTFFDLEPGAICALQTEDPKWPPVYPIGPMVKYGLDRVEDGPGLKCLEWLAQQPAGSVLFVCFGSGGTLSQKQVDELAIGLEKSGQRFLWVVKRPSDGSACGSYINGSSQVDLFDFLPEGFLDRTMDRGLVVPNWAPQVEVLRHESTGGFLTHCGWNSTLESIIHEVPLVTWPLFAEQRMNVVMLTEGLKVGLRPKANEDGLIEADEVARVVTELMEGDQGKKAHNQMKKFRNLAKRALSKEGDSSVVLETIALKWTQNQTHKS